MPRTIFVTSFHVLISRNILATAVFRGLSADPGVRVVLFVPATKQGYFTATFGGPNVTVEGVRLELSRRELLLRALALAALASRTLRIKRRAEFAATGNFAKFLAKEALAFLCGGRGWARRMLWWLDRMLAPTSVADTYVERYRPALVFSTDIQNELDLQFARSARRHGVRVVAMVRSWDNLTAKGVLRFIPDALAVGSDGVHREAVALDGVDPARVHIVGIPHYDSYRSEALTPREAFLRSTGLDPGGRLVLIAPVGDRYICEFQRACHNRTDRAILDALLDARANGLLPSDVQFLIRLPPADTVNLDGFMPPRGTAIEQPGVGAGSSGIKERELSRDDDRRLITSLVYAAAVVTGPSSMAVDAARFDRPIIIPTFDAESRPYPLSLRRFYDYDHFRPIMESGGAAVAHSPEELAAAVGAALAHPEDGRDGRRRIVSETCGADDGRASERLLALLL